MWLVPEVFPVTVPYQGDIQVQSDPLHGPGYLLKSQPVIPGYGAVSPRSQAHHMPGEMPALQGPGGTDGPKSTLTFPGASPFNYRKIHRAQGQGKPGDPGQIRMNVFQSFLTALCKFPCHHVFPLLCKKRCHNLFRRLPPSVLLTPAITSVMNSL